MKIRLFFTFIFMISFAWQGFSDGNEPLAEKASSQVSISGMVVDKDTGEELVCANIMIDGIDYKTSTDIRGKFKIKSLPPGTYTLKVQYISYQETILKKIKVKKNKPANLKIELEQITL